MLNKTNIVSKTSWVIVLTILCGSVAHPAPQNQAAPDPRLQFVDFAVTTYRAFERKDRLALLSVCAASSSHCEEFKQIVDAQLGLVGNLKLELKRILILKATVHDDRAEVRVLSTFQALDEKGEPSEVIPGEWDHTLHLIKEGNGWKLWRFTDTAETFAAAYLKLDTDEQRERLLVDAQPISNGFTKALVDEALSLLEERGDDIKAATLFQIAARLSAENKNLGGELNAQIGMGDVYLTRGDYARAADNYQKVLTVVERLNSKEGVAAVAVKMGNLHYQQGNLAQAMEYYLKSVRLYEELGSDIEITYPLVNLGSAYFSLGNYEKALEHYLKIYKIYEQLHAKAGTAWLSNKIADVYLAQGKNELALAAYSLALKIHEEFENKTSQAYSLFGMGRVRLAEGNYREALALFVRAINLARTANSPEILWKGLNLLGQTQRALKNPIEARQAYLESISIVEKLRNQAVGNEQDQELWFADKTAPYLGMVELSVEQGNLAEALIYAERSKGRMLLDILHNGKSDLAQSLTAEERERERNLSSAMISISSQIRQESSLPRPDDSKIASTEARLRQARLDYESYETRIYAAHPELKTRRGETHEVNLKEVESLITDTRSAFLEYVVTPDRTYAFVLTRKTIPGDLDLKVYSIPVSAIDLARRVSDFRQTLARNSPAFKASARELHDLLLLPVQRELADKTTLCIVPSSQLWELPFQALMSPAEKYLIEDRALFYVPSLSVLYEIRNKRQTSAGRSGQENESLMRRVNLVSGRRSPSLFAMGNPSLSASAVSRVSATDRSIALGELPEAEREVKALGEIYGPQRSMILTGREAMESIAKAQAGKYTILHFATHGILDNDNPLYSRLLLASSSTEDDGYLEAREIMNLNLRADLAVLSACQTGLGRVSDGEGLIGMSWALFIAGTSSTVTSQWKVDSASTARLMVDFHRALQESNDGVGMHTAEALRKASLKLMVDPKYRHPFYWAGFVVVGEGL